MRLLSVLNRYQMELLSSGVKRKLWADQLQMSLAHTPLIDAGINVNTHFDGVFLGDDEYPELNSELNKLAKKYGVSADAIAYAWLLRYPARMQVILGTTNPKRVEGAAKAAEITLTRGEWYALYKAAGNQLP